ncbi:helix-turn-helix domain-containing protein [Anaerovibrio sp.]|uniref:helix-turn-helix domain-containing protein n=1 Tax=Anaerovibrio sp. TaxID=1872532 RepID=UPI003F1570F6
MAEYDKKGYLLQGFRVFRLADTSLQEIPFHYHDFHKIILFLDGEASYIIEGKTYPLTARDILFVSAGEIHRPVTVPGRSYERIVIYVSPDFLASCGQGKCDLARCFQVAREASSVMHAPPGKSHDLLFHMNKLENAAHQAGYANELYTEMLFIEFMILLNRAILDNELELASVSCDKKIQQLLAYINGHLTEELSIDTLAEKVYLSKFYMMRKFKADTGCSIHQYINSKRLLLAKSLLATTDIPITELCYQCGFTDYSAFSREFRKSFRTTPTAFRNSNT